jgi:hypothetical protein
MQKEILIARRNELAVLLKEAHDNGDNGENAIRIIVEMGKIGDKIKEIEKYGE